MIHRKFLFLFLVLTIICPLTVIGIEIEDGYEQTWRIGEIIGYYDGLLYDYIPKYSEVLNKYKVYFSNEDTKHSDYFIDGYFQGFEKSYKKNIDNNEPDKVEYVQYADILGLTLGEIYGNRDYYSGKKYDSRHAIPRDKDIIKNYKLNNLSPQDRSSFLKTFKEAFEKGYREGYLIANFDSIRTSYEAGLSHGDYFGKLLGEMNGVKDYFRGLDRNYKRNMPTDKEIENTYFLNKDGQEYKEAFIEAFKNAYEASYNKSYSSMKTEENIKPYELGYNTGKESGRIQGRSFATIDFYNGLDNNWRKYYPSSSEIIREYNLLLQDVSYKDIFIIGFIEGLYEGYTEEYERLYTQYYINSTTTEVISISGGILNSPDMSLSVKVEEGTYYNPVIIKIDRLFSNSYDSKDLIKASNTYRISIANSSNISNDDKSIELSFEYYGGDNGGIYKLVDNKWLYIPSKIEEGSIKAFVKPGSIKDTGSTYGVFVDRDYNLLFDIRSHWAKEEIITYQKRNIVKGYSDRTFRPDNEITKREFFAILSKVYNWPGSNLEAEPYIDTMRFALEMGYIESLTDKEINTPLTYREVEIIMRKVLNSENFHWYNIAAKMLYEKQYKCNSFYSKDNNITRAEAIYMLYIMNEWRC